MHLKPTKKNLLTIAILALTAFDLPYQVGLARGIFIWLAAISVGLFFRTVTRRLFSVFPKHGDLPHDHIPKRLWRIFVEVVLQYRVVRDRPLVGLLHAFVLWGFFAFGWVSANHLLLGLRGLDKAPGERTWYGAFVAVWAVAVLVGMIGLSFRRFVLRPKALGKLSPTSGAVAFLISALMVTYLLGWGVFLVGSLSWKVNWWLHTLSFFALLVVIPISKHLHLVLAPVTIFFRPETTSSMRALKEDGDDLGMIHLKDLGRKDVLDVDACVECGRCTDVCPANLSGGTLSPKEIILDLRQGLLSGGDVVAGTEEEKKQGKAFITEEDLFQCFSCGACEYVCPVGIEHVGRKILDLRRGLASEGRISNDRVNQLFTTMERAPHNPWGIAHDTRQKLIESKQFPIFDGSQEWLFWLGCGLSFDPHGQAVAQAMRQILDAAGVSWGVLARETCCGEPARRAGNEYLFMELSGKLVESFEAARVKKIVTCCPHCTTMLDKDYRQNASYTQLGIEVWHHTEFIAQVLPKLQLRSSAAAMGRAPLGPTTTATYHDPCYLARGRGITAAPREILRAAGVVITEVAHHGQNTQCCGAGGAQLFVADDTREQGKVRVNQRRFTELMQTQATTVAVACPYCPIMLRDASNALKRDDVEILDIAEIVARNLAP
ncbi:MAG: (Fe-S)-binding protein [Terriglobia bacterium]|jgi:Fe-S oxidoreductase